MLAAALQLGEPRVCSNQPQLRATLMTSTNAPASDEAEADKLAAKRAARRSLKIALGVGALFMILIAVIIYLLAKAVITPQMAMLMFVALLGLYVGFGVLIAAYRFVNKLE
jgi:hypothetical protein